MRRRFAAFVLWAVAAGAAEGDVLVLQDGRKVAGKVVEKEDGYEITVEGQKLAFAKDRANWIKNPKELLGDSDQLIGDAKNNYLLAVDMEDAKAAQKLFLDALQKVTRAREAYAEARDLFPDGFPEMDAQLITIMKLMRLVRERIGSEIAGGKTEPRQVLPPLRTAPPPVFKPMEPPPVAEAPKKEPPPPPAPEPLKAPSMESALAILADPAARADEKRSESARTTFRAAWDGRGPQADLAAAGCLFLSRDEKLWRLVEDIVTVKGLNFENTYRGKLIRRDAPVSTLVISPLKELRIRKAADAVYVAPPGGTEFKTVAFKLTEDVKTPAFEAMQDFFKALSGGTPSVKTLVEEAGLLSLKAKEMRSKDAQAPVDALMLFSGGLASTAVAGNSGKATPELESLFENLGYGKSEFGTVWGSPEGLALDDFHKWKSSGEFGLAVVQFQRDYKNVADFGARYALGLLLTFKALADNRNYNKAAIQFEQMAKTAAADARDHLEALARSIRTATPCAACGGTREVNCTACRGTTKANLQCNACGGSGQVQTTRGVAMCQACKGVGRWYNIPCPKCKATGKAPCKARNCRAIPTPTFETFAEAYQCSLCKGLGSIFRHVAYSCPECAGIGMLLSPKAEPARMLR